MLSDPAIQSSFSNATSEARLDWPASRDQDDAASPRLNILHVLRAPVGGLFRHVCDLAEAQASAGHLVGVVVDATTFDSLTNARLEKLSQHLALGLNRTAMARQPSLRDLFSARAVARIADTCAIDVIHGHGAKGGTFARLAAWQLKQSQKAPPQTFYTPHGGALHYQATSIAGRVFGFVERKLLEHTSGLIFESAFAARAYAEVMTQGTPPARVIPNGVHVSEFEPVTPNTSAADFVFVGELRHLKGIDVLLAAMAALGPDDTTTLAVVGDGAERDRFERLSTNLGLANRVVFRGAMPARAAFKLGRTLVLPSRKESLPYILLEAGAAGVPIIASNVGGVPEILEGTATWLVKPGDIDDLAAALLRRRAPSLPAAAAASALKARIREQFTVDTMHANIQAFYANCGAGKVKACQI